MKILIISHFFPPASNAGAEKRALAYALGLRNLGYEVQVVCAGNWNKGPQYWNGYRDDNYLGIPVRRVDLNWAAAADINLFLYDSAVVEQHLDQWLNDWQPDLVHIISMVTLSTSVIRPVKKRGIPIVFTLTDFWMICPKISLVRGDGSLCDGQTTGWDCLRCLMWKTKAYRGLSKAMTESQTAALLTWVSRQPQLNRLPGLRGMAMDMDHRKQRMKETLEMIDAITAPSHALARVIEESGILNQSVQVIQSGHDLSWVEHMPAREPSEVLRLGYIGQVIPVKGLEILVRGFQLAAPYAERLGRRVELKIYGDPNHEPGYTAHIKSILRPGDAITFMGAFAHNQLGQVLAGIDALVVPSQWHENNPRVIQEAFAGKTPVVASDVGGIAEFVQHDVNGLLFKYDSAADLEQQLCRLIDEPELIERLRGGIQPVKTIQQEIQEVVCIYRELTREKSAYDMHRSAIQSL